MVTLGQNNLTINLITKPLSRIHKQRGWICVY